MARTWNEVVNNAIEAFRSNQYVYFYGAKNIVLTDANMDYLISVNPSYFARYTAEEMAQIKRNSRGKRGIDCSGFTGWICTGDKQYSIGQINNCSKYNSLQAGPTGSVLFTSWGGTGRHIGLDVGGGLCMHIGWESTDRAIREGRAGILFEPIANRAWERSGQSRVVDFSGVYSPYEPVIQLWNEIHGGPTPTPPIDGWVGEAFGKAIVPVYADPTSTKLLKEHPQLAKGNLFEVHGEIGERYKVWISNKYYGWVEKQYVLRRKPYTTGTITSRIVLRDSPNVSYNTLASMPKGSVVDICDKKNVSGLERTYIIYNGIYGFASSKYIKEK